MESGSILDRIKDKNIRAAILDRLLTVQVCIPSIETFHEDTKWLEPCSAAIREHILPKSSLSLFRDLSRAFDHRQSVLDKDENHMSADKRNDFILAYRRLFAFAWKYFPELTGISPKQNHGGPKQLSRSHNDLVQNEFRKYASGLGFKTSKTLSDMFSPEIVMIRKFLSNIRPPDLFRLDQQTEEQLIAGIHTIIRDSYQQYVVETPSISQESSLDNRCGRPCFKVWNFARMFFDYEHIYEHGENHKVVFADQRDIFILFFGKHNGVLPSNDAAESGVSGEQAVDFTNNSLVVRTIDDNLQIQPQSATDYYEDGNNVSFASQIPLDQEFLPNELTRKRRHEDGQPLEKEPRLDFDVTWFTDVLINARNIKKIPSAASPSSHLIVLDISKKEFDVWERNKILDLFKENPEYSFRIEVSQVSKEGRIWNLQSVSPTTTVSEGSGGSRRFEGRNLLFMYRNTNEEDELLKRHKEDCTQFWQHILELSTQPGSYMSTL